MANDGSKIFTLAVLPGIKRDGTRFEGNKFEDGSWIRFQRNKVRKIGGYRQMFASPTGVARGMITNSLNGVNYIYTGNSTGIEVFNTGTDQGVGVGPFQAEFNNTYVATAVNTGANTIELYGNQTTVFTLGAAFWTYNTANVRTPLVVSVAATYNSGTNRTTFTVASVTGLKTSPFEVYVAAGLVSSTAYLWQFDIAYDSTGTGNSKLLAHPGHNLDNLDSGVLTSLYAGNFLPDATTGNYVLTQVVDSTGQYPTYQPIDVSGGVVVLHPFVFVYSNFGNLRNNNVVFDSATANVQTFSDWNGPLANDTNVASGKIVKGVPVRGGTSSPSGLFWATDSLIRASFTGQTPYYWRYDIIAGQISIMSSSSVVEMDGVYFWMGVDRFYVYNGSVQVLPNDDNVNYLFDNLNYSQRQKVWATKVPRYNEIWFFYPRGTDTECSDAIIYNVKDKLWYDAGSAEGSRRSCGYVTEVFPHPIWAGWEFSGRIGATYNVLYGPNSTTPIVTNAYQVVLSGDLTTNPAGSYMTFNDDLDVNFDSINQITAAVFTDTATGGYTIMTFSKPLTGITAGATMTQTTGGHVIWEHEFGLNKISDIEEFAIDSWFETCDISFVGGTPAEDTTVTANNRMHISRIEPDFNQQGPMQLTIVGRPFAQGTMEDQGPFTFEDTDGKIDLRAEHRLVNLRFRSNVIDGFFEAGRLMITCELGDERP